MIDRKYLIGIVLGFMIGIIMIPVSSDALESIPPTAAWFSVDVDTSPWAVTNTDVNATLYNDQFFFVSDGSITFNVTESYP